MGDIVSGLEWWCGLRGERCMQRHQELQLKMSTLEYRYRHDKFRGIGWSPMNPYIMAPVTTLALLLWRDSYGD